MRRFYLGAVLGLLTSCGDPSEVTNTDPDVPRDTLAEDDADASTQDAEDSSAADITDTEGAESLDHIDDVGHTDASMPDADAPLVDSVEPLDDDLLPCENLEFWPNSILSDRLPMRVHFRTRADLPLALEALNELELSWDAEVTELGFRAPLLDDGRCGPDDRFDIFIWRGYEECYVDLVGGIPETPIDDGAPFMVLDPAGPYGGEWLDVTVAHELNHACQAAYDWNDAAFIYEATSTFMEDIIHDDDDSYLTVLHDFQFHTDWSLDRNDGYETWYMYGAGLYLHYLHERFFPNEPSFIVRLWEGLASPPRANEPDIADSIDGLLQSAGLSYTDSIVEFARWRWYVGTRDDGRHLSEASAFPEEASPRVLETFDSAGGAVAISPMMFGTVYIDVASDTSDVTRFEVDLRLDDEGLDVDFVIQVLPGENDDDGAFVSRGETLSLLPDGNAFRRTIAVTAIPHTPERADPDLRTDARFDAVLSVSPR